MTDRIVVGIDGSPASLDALEWAVRQAELTDASLEVVAVWCWPSAQWGLSAAVPVEFDPSAYAETAVEEALAEVRHGHPDVRVTGETMEGHPATCLVEVSQWADLLVVGSRGHGEFAGMLLGSVSEYCATKAHCPVVVVRPMEHTVGHDGHSRTSPALASPHR